MADKKESRRVFIFPGSTQIAREVVRSLVYLPGYVLFGGGFATNFDWMSSYHHYFPLPDFRDPKFPAKLAEALQDSKATHLYPANDFVIKRIAELTLHLGIRIIGHPASTIAITSSKILTAKHFAPAKIAPRVHSDDAPPGIFPVFVKPDQGHSSKGARIIKSRRALQLLERNPKFWNEHLVSEFLPGLEVTVDCFSSRRTGLMLAAARVRENIEGGMSVSTYDIEDTGLNEMAAKIDEQLRLFGPWFFQARKSSRGNFKLMEIGARIAGFSALRRAQGINLSHLSVLEADGVPLEISRQKLQLSARLDAGTPEFKAPVRFRRLFVDLDDTLVLHGKVNPHVEGLVRHARNLGAVTAVITRSIYDPRKFLESIGILHLFDEVIHITNETPKEALISVGEHCLLLDDSFSERQSFKNRQDVLTADASVAESVRGFFE